MKSHESQKCLHCVFVDLEKTNVMVQRAELWFSMRKPGVVEKYVKGNTSGSCTLI